ncbi:hypothetical protein EDI_246300 [Entamoeba dispar SAW760]|uniref:HIT-type domain-containing protein n=1 Tax=Entamoeba dispar (strain ATCC PRA-260 / SAW760) TaxID=370354 RepID=B0EEN8_ENTDS|nr:uncharacterized protein EDI_246300 [Entamoeba dispar SAW760]EDR27014.1 hypothetical protein EDI_246300 [Entamoeba dispar SAW760]|eukprot:EDR27014.1 hypothetical protein EDI_246300 [Entamoeba dispar SAW760]
MSKKYIEKKCCVDKKDSRYVCPRCYQGVCSVNCYQTHNNGNCFNSFSSNEINQLMKFKIKDDEIQLFKGILQRDGTLDKEKYDTKNIDDMLLRKIESGEINDIDQLKAVLSQNQLQEFEKNLTKLCQQQIEQYVPWYLSVSSSNLPREIITSINVIKVSPVVVQCIDYCCVVYIALTRMYVSTEIFDVYSSEIDVQLQELLPFLYQRYPTTFPMDCTYYVIDWMKKNEYIENTPQMVSLIRGDYQIIKEDIHLLSLLISHLHQFYSQLPLISKKLEFYYAFINSQQYRSIVISYIN